MHRLKLRRSSHECSIRVFCCVHSIRILFAFLFTVARPEVLTALSAFVAEASPMCALDVALPAFAYEEATTVDGAK